MRKHLIAAVIVCTVVFLMTVFGEQAVETPRGRIVPDVDINIAEGIILWEDQGLASVIGEENITEAETEKTTTEATVPAAEDFEYTYDTVLGGVKITKYNGDAKAICIPAEIDCYPVKQVEISTTTVI